MVGVLLCYCLVGVGHCHESMCLTHWLAISTKTGRCYCHSAAAVAVVDWLWVAKYLTCYLCCSEGFEMAHCFCTLA